MVVTGAEFCKDCGAPLAGSRFFAKNPGFNPVMAAILSLVPGLGHVYKGRPGRGAVWFFVVSFAYAASPSFGLLMHLICAANAALKGAVDEHAFARIGRRRRPFPPYGR